MQTQLNAVRLTSVSTHSDLELPQSDRSDLGMPTPGQRHTHCHEFREVYTDENIQFVTFTKLSKVKEWVAKKHS